MADAKKSVVAAAVSGAAAALYYGVNQNIALPGGFSLRAPLGMAVHVGLSSFVSELVASMDNVQKALGDFKDYAAPVGTAVVTPSLLMVAGDQTVSTAEGAVIGGLSQLVADIYTPKTTTQGGNIHASYTGYGSSSVYGQGDKYRVTGGGCGRGCGGGVSMYKP